MILISVPRSRRWVAKLWRSACSVTLFLIPAASAASWKRRLNWRVVIGLPAPLPDFLLGNSQRSWRGVPASPRDGRSFHHCRNKSRVSGDRRALKKCSKPLAAGDVAPLRVRTKLARVHVLDHALAQRADRIRAHRQLLSWMGARHLDPQDRAPRPPPTISRLGTVLAVRPPRSGLSRSDLVRWHEAAARGSATSRQILRVEQTCHGRRGTAESVESRG